MNVLIFFLGSIFQNIPRFPRFRDLRNLRQLTLISFSYLAKSLLCCTHMLKASPFLHKFALKVNIATTYYFIVYNFRVMGFIVQKFCNVCFHLSLAIGCLFLHIVYGFYYTCVFCNQRISLL